jgi:hypothetical protein
MRDWFTIKAKNYLQDPDDEKNYIEKEFTFSPCLAEQFGESMKEQFQKKHLELALCID